MLEELLDDEEELDQPIQGLHSSEVEFKLNSTIRGLFEEEYRKRKPYFG